jgi:hypothetical protein
MAARRGAIWTVSGSQLRRQAQYQDDAFPETPSDRERGNELLRRVALSGESLVSDPIEEAHTVEDAFGSGWSLLLAVPVKRKQQTIAIIEIAQEPGATIELMRNNLRFLEQICNLTNERIGKLVDTQSDANLAPATEPVPEAAAVGRKRWWQVWKN